MEKEDIYITGDTVVIKSVTENDIEDYLYIKRYATLFKAEYDKENGFWEYMKPRLIEDINGNDCICLIYLQNTGRVLGYIDLELENVRRPQVGIGILEEDRNKGYAFEASRLLLQKVLEYEEIELPGNLVEKSLGKNRLFPKKHWNVGKRKFLRRKYPVMLYMGYIGDLANILSVSKLGKLAKEECWQWKFQE